MYLLDESNDRANDKRTRKGLCIDYVAFGSVVCNDEKGREMAGKIRSEASGIRQRACPM